MIVSSCKVTNKNRAAPLYDKQTQKKHRFFMEKGFRPNLFFIFARYKTIPRKLIEV